MMSLIYVIGLLLAPTTSAQTSRVIKAKGDQYVIGTQNVQSPWTVDEAVCIHRKKKVIGCGTIIQSGEKTVEAKIAYRNRQSLAIEHVVETEKGTFLSLEFYRNVAKKNDKMVSTEPRVNSSPGDWWKIYKHRRQTHLMPRKQPEYQMAGWPLKTKLQWEKTPNLYPYRKFLGPDPIFGTLNWKIPETAEPPKKRIPASIPKKEAVKEPIPPEKTEVPENTGPEIAPELLDGDTTGLLGMGDPPLFGGDPNAGFGGPPDWQQQLIQNRTPPPASQNPEYGPEENIPFNLEEVPPDSETE